MTIETYKHAPLTDGFFRMVNPAHIDATTRQSRGNWTLAGRLREGSAQRRALEIEQLSGISQSGSNASNPWQVPGNTWSSVATPADMRRRA